MAEGQMEKTAKPTRREKSVLKDRMTNLLMFLPNMVKLLGRLLTDNRVAAADKALFAAAIVYVIVPLDFIPDVFPFIGQVDDLYLVALTLIRLINRTDQKIIREHWSGGGDVAALADSIANIAPMLLPKRVSRVLSSKVELTPAARSIADTAKKQPILTVEAAPSEQIEK